MENDHGHVVIVGAGIAGLAFSIALTQRGVPAERQRVIERASQPAEEGAGITLHTHGQAALRALGISVEARAIKEIVIADAASQPLQRSAPQIPLLAISRPALLRALVEATETEILFGHSVGSLRPCPHGIEVTFADGSHQLASQLVAADGLYSHTRALLGNPITPRYAGYTCYRALLDVDLDLDAAYECWGRGRRVGVVPMPNGTYVYLTENAPAGTMASLPNADTIRDRFAEFSGIAERALAHLPDEFLHHDLSFLPRHDFGRAPSYLIGDAAHGFTPNLGMGASVALEDALQLADALRHPERTSYPGLRRRDLARVAQRSQRIGQVAQWQHPIAVRLRDALTKAFPSPPMAKLLPPVYTTSHAT